jgi:cytochrome c oxidase subunit IV
VIGLRSQTLVWLALLILLVLTIGASFAFTGIASAAVGMAFAFAKAGLVFWFFMHLRQESGLVRLAAFGAAAWLLILLTLSGTDYLSRAATG